MSKQYFPSLVAIAYNYMLLAYYCIYTFKRRVLCHCRTLHVYPVTRLLCPLTCKKGYFSRLCSYSSHDVHTSHLLETQQAGPPQFDPFGMALAAEICNRSSRYFLQLTTYVEDWTGLFFVSITDPIASMFALTFKDQMSCCCLMPVTRQSKPCGA